MGNITFHRERLYDNVWSKPVSHLAKDFGITSHQLYKVCQELNVPTPSSGYWAKKRHNKTVKKPALPESKKETYTLTVRGKLTSSEKTVNSKKTITVSKRLTKPHILVKQARDDIDKNSLNRFNRVRGGRPLDISVSPDNVKRGLLILDALLKELEKRGYSVHTERHNSSYWTYIKIDKDKMYIQLREEGTRRKRTEKKHSWGYEYEYNPTGKLKLLLLENRWQTSSKVLSDTKSEKLEDRLDEFFFKLESMAEKIKSKRLKREERHKKRELEQQIEEAIEDQEKSEQERLAKLKQRANSFMKSQYIYDFIAEIENLQSQLDLSEEEQLKFKGWLIWTRNHADRLNPVKQMVKEILGPSGNN
ncbi:hypothetical protein [Fodinibius roseus]|nr:hypothetical protein [Fodinibius roseus]